MTNNFPQLALSKKHGSITFELHYIVAQNVEDEQQLAQKLLTFNQRENIRETATM
ncbi:MAG: hypothetical protein IKT98_05480 [Selenomonadaceae bacterium]|nr:hypothetical protein [Selenomonadaceae bacterium]